MAATTGHYFVGGDGARRSPLLPSAPRTRAALLLLYPCPCDGRRRVLSSASASSGAAVCALYPRRDPLVPASLLRPHRRCSGGNCCHPCALHRHRLTLLPAQQQHQQQQQQQVAGHRRPQGDATALLDADVGPATAVVLPPQPATPRRNEPWPELHPVAGPLANEAPMMAPDVSAAPTAASVLPAGAAATASGTTSAPISAVTSSTATATTAATAAARAQSERTDELPDLSFMLARVLMFRLVATEGAE